MPNIRAWTIVTTNTVGRRPQGLAIRSRLRAVTALLVIGMLLGGCGRPYMKPDYFAANLGIRPNPPVFDGPASCEQQLTQYVNYSLVLDESYRARASQNRGWIYVAGLLGIGTVAATGGLGIAGAAGVTLALLSVSGASASSAFAVINNPDLANIYTICANDIAKAVAQSRATANDKTDAEKSCRTALDELTSKVTEARNNLESARTDNAVASVLRAKQEVETLKMQVEAAKEFVATPTATAADGTATPTKAEGE